MGEEKRNRISGVSGFFMIAVALVTDLLQIGLDILFGAGVIVNRFVDVIFALGFGMWLALSDVTLWSNPRIGLTLGATFIGEQIPGVDVFPFWTADVVYIISQVRAEDGSAGILGKTIAAAGGLATGKLPTKGVKPPPFPKQPPPLPKQPPPLPKQLPSTAAAFQPLPHNPLATEHASTLSTTQPGQEIASRRSSLPTRDTGVNPSQYEREVQRRVGERARALQDLATEYRHGIEERTRRYGAQARSGQEYIRSGRTSNTNKG